MNWLHLLPYWMRHPIEACLLPEGTDSVAVTFRQPEALNASPDTFWWLLLIATLLALVGTYLGAWREKLHIKLIGYAGATAAVLAFIGMGFRSISGTSGTMVHANYPYALGNFSFWLLICLAVMGLSLAAHRWGGVEAGKIGSSIFSECLSFLCICWMFFAYALSNCA